MAPPGRRGGARSSGSLRGGSRGRGRGRGRGHGRGRTTDNPRTRFRNSRLQDLQSGSDDESDESPVDEPHEEDSNQQVETSSSDEDSDQAEGLYATLLQSLHTASRPDEPARKKRKIESPKSSGLDTHSSPEDLEGRKNPGSNRSKVNRSHTNGEKGTFESGSAASNDEGDDGYSDLEDVAEDEGEIQNEETAAVEDDGEADDWEDLSDPFDQHFHGPEVLSNVKAIRETLRQTTSSKIKGKLRKTTVLPQLERSSDSKQETSLITRPTHLKARLQETGLKAWSRLGEVEKDLGSSVLQYRDVIFADRSVRNASDLRDLICLQALNHVFKTRDRVSKNNVRLSRDTSGDMPELRDQGFTRPKVLFILPTKNSCVQFVESLVRLSSPQQQENKSRFQDSFANTEESKEWGDDKPEDFRELFSGNDDDMFRIGFKFTRKTLKYYSQFYQSDIILASPLGLRTVIESSGKDKNHDSDFLSSIEIAIIDHADALLMQNWQHVEYIFSQLNLLPKDSHGCDFTRVRNIYLDNLSKYFRQTIILSPFLSPEINALATSHLHNQTGLVKYVPTYSGTMLNLPATIPPSTTQTFLRFNSPSPSSDPSLRFTYFTTTLLPALLPTSRTKGLGGTLLFVPSYFSFLRLQTHLSSDPSCTSLAFSSITEYSSHSDAARTRSHFANGRYSLLLYTERAHHFRRFQSIRGVKRVIFFGIPENHIFWAEICGYLGGDSVKGEDNRSQGKGRIRALFSKWDVLKLERIVGTERVGKMIRGDEGDVFEFV
ncbi:putative nucleolus protein required for cell [Phaeomoniella chlamydospora]|uniref:U3 small nucleolar RNA-associated protein 25 n=1 Tax=Phaeomoniella chlamydospora TaxID=158046 RepID=A0A0G2EPC6_PHACM|nr:putative nucleolus protein required for cell [Phaeomoniella chlamydospora]